ncbi:MAG: hypothetical protein JSW10_09150 [Pseudomonadota bacterium]|nr:MAG: hypothetical protein JSW10_09150 [Pseudomonadota bacterium]
MGIDSIRKSNKVIKLAIWVKENAHSLRETALLFFALALFAGVIWISGKDVEPIAYVLGLVSTLLFVSPSIARYVLPDRKPVRDMSYDEILDFITSSNPKLDWKRIETNWAEEAFLKEDLRLRIRVRHDEDVMHVKDFNESLATTHLDPTANCYWYDLSYAGGIIDRFILVSVDGGQAKLPLPVPATLEVAPLAYKVAQIFDEHNTLEEYMGRAGFSVKKA